jgi:hypothetical protein
VKVVSGCNFSLHFAGVELVHLVECDRDSLFTQFLKPASDRFGPGIATVEINNHTDDREGQEERKLFDPGAMLGFHRFQTSQDSEDCEWTVERKQQQAVSVVRLKGVSDRIQTKVD